MFRLIGLKGKHDLEAPLIVGNGIIFNDSLYDEFQDAIDTLEENGNTPTPKVKVKYSASNSEIFVVMVDQRSGCADEMKPNDIHAIGGYGRSDPYLIYIFAGPQEFTDYAQEVVRKFHLTVEQMQEFSTILGPEFLYVIPDPEPDPPLVINTFDTGPVEIVKDEKKESGLFSKLWKRVRSIFK